MSGEILEVGKKGGRPTNKDRATSSFYKPSVMWLTLRMFAEYAAGLDIEPAAADDSPYAKILVRALNDFLRKKKGTAASERDRLFRVFLPQ